MINNVKKFVIETFHISKYGINLKEISLNKHFAALYVGNYEGSI